MTKAQKTKLIAKVEKAHARYSGFLTKLENSKSDPDMIDTYYRCAGMVVAFNAVLKGLEGDMNSLEIYGGEK